MYARLGVAAYWLLWPGIWLYTLHSRRTRIVLHSGSRIMVVRGWLSDGRWMLPGGGLHRGERPLSGALRELYEETGLRLPEDAVRPLAAEDFSADGYRFYCHYFAHETALELTPTADRREILEVRWINRADVSRKSCRRDVQRALELLDAG